MAPRFVEARNFARRPMCASSDDALKLVATYEAYVPALGAAGARPGLASGDRDDRSLRRRVLRERLRRNEGARERREPLSPSASRDSSAARRASSAAFRGDLASPSRNQAGNASMIDGGTGGGGSQKV